jgi:hypothetical protein
MAIDNQNARAVLDRLNAWGDYHALSSATVEALASEARRLGYRAPRVRNGSATRSFHAFLMRRAGA